MRQVSLAGRSTFLHAVLAALALGLVIGAAADEKDKGGAGDGAADKAALQGTWAPVSSESDGNPDAEEDYKQYRLTFEGDGFTVRRGGDVHLKGTYKLEAGQTPRRIDMTCTEGPDGGDVKMLKGIYEVKGDELKWCFAPPDGGERPTEFGSKSGSGHIFATLKREKK